MSGFQLSLEVPPLSPDEAARWHRTVLALVTDLADSWPEVAEVRAALVAWLATPDAGTEEELCRRVVGLSALDKRSRKLPRLKRLLELGVGGRAADVLAQEDGR